jgi:hypothetical protein
VFLGFENVFFKNETTACKITRYRMARLKGLLGIHTSTPTSVGVDVFAFESTDIYAFNLHKVPEYLFSILDTSER